MQFLHVGIYGLSSAVIMASSAWPSAGDVARLSISGYVENQAGDPVSCAEVWAIYGNQSIPAITRYDGHFDFHPIACPRSTAFRLRAHAIGFADVLTDSMLVNSDTTLSITITLITGDSPPDSLAGYGSLSGVVTDSTGEVLPGCSVVLEDRMRGAASNFEGRYVISCIPAGKHIVTVQLIGFRKQVLDSIVVYPHSITQLNFRLTAISVKILGPISCPGRPPFDRYETSNVKRINSEDIETMPVKNLGDILKILQ